MFVSYQKFFAVPLVVYEHVYEVLSLYYIGKLGFQNPCFSTDSREIEYIYIEYIYIYTKTKKFGGLLTAPDTLWMAIPYW